MLGFFESTWILWWVIAILILLRWFHANALGPEADEPEAGRRAGPSSNGITAHVTG